MLPAATPASRRLLLLLAVGLLVVGVLAPAATAQSTAPDDGALEDGANVTIPSDELEGQTFHGESVTVENLTPFDDGTVEARKRSGTSSEFVGDVDVENGSITLDTAELAAQRYVIHDANGDRGPFEVVRQEITVSGTNPILGDGTAALAFEDDNRGAAVDLLLSTRSAGSNGGLEHGVDASLLDDAIGGDEFETAVEDDETLRVRDVSEGQQIPIDVDAFDADLGSFTVGVSDTRAWDTATVPLDETVDHDRELSAAVLDGAVVWRGQTVAIEGLTPSENGTVELRARDEAESTFRRSVELDRGDRLTVDTQFLDPGTYVVRDANGTWGEVDVLEQEITTSAVDHVEYASTAGIEFTEDNRGDPVDLLVDWKRSFDADRVDDEIGGDEFETSIEDDGAIRVHDVRAGQTVPVDVTNYSQGQFWFGVEVADTGAQDSVQFSSGANTNHRVAIDDLDRRRYWTGQDLTVTGFEPNEPVEIRGADDRERDADSDGSVVIYTNTLEPGEYTVEGLSTGTTNTLRHREHRFETLAFESDANGSSTLAIESNRAQYNVILQATDIDAETFAAAFEDGLIRKGDFLLHVPASEHSFEFDESELPPGSHSPTLLVDDVAKGKLLYLDVEEQPDENELSADEIVSVDELDDEQSGRYWLGQELAITGLPAGTDVQFLGPDYAHRERTTDDRGVTVETDGWTAGEYTLQVNGSDDVGTFDLLEPTIEVDVIDTDPRDEAAFTVELNRSGYTVELSSDDLDAETLADSIAGASLVEGRVLVDAESERHVARLDRFELPGGVHEITVRDVSSTATATTTVTVGPGIEVDGLYPMPYEGSEAYYDVNGDRTLTNGDVVEFFGFQHYHPAVDEHPERFDFDGTGDVGQGDVVELFEIVNGDSEITRSVAT